MNTTITLPTWFDILQDNAQNPLTPIFEEIISTDDRSIHFKYKTVEFSIYRERIDSMSRYMRETAHYFFKDGEHFYKLSAPLDEDDSNMVSVAAGVSVSSDWAKHCGLRPRSKRDIFCDRTHGELCCLLEAEFAPKKE